MCVPREWNIFSKRHLARICSLFSPNNTNSTSSTVRWHCNPSSRGPQLLSCPTNDQSVDRPHGRERISIGILCRIFRPRSKPRSFRESVRRQRAVRCTRWSSDILLDLGWLHADGHHGGGDQESTTDHSNRYRRRYCSSRSGVPRRRGDDPRSTRFSVNGERRRATLQSSNTGSRNMGRISSLGVCLERISKRTHRRSANRIASRIHDGRGKRTSALAWLSPPEVSHPSKCCSDHMLDSSGISPELRPSKIVGRCQHLHAYLVHYHSFLCLTIAQRAATDDPIVLLAWVARLSFAGRLSADLGQTHRRCSTCYSCRVSSAIVSLPNS